MIRERVAYQRDQWRELGSNYWLALEFILRNAQVFQGQPLSRRYVRRAPKACFFNSRQLVLGSKTLRYCEGICFDPTIDFEFQHAWAIDRHDRVIECTLPAGRHDCEYLGVVLERKWLKREWRYSGVLSGEFGNWRIEVCEAIDPAWAALIHM